MSWTPPPASHFRERLSLERQIRVRDAGGGFDDTWTTVEADMAAAVAHQRGNERVIADRLSGISNYEIVLRACATTECVSTADRLVDRAGRTFDIKWIGSLDIARRYVVIHAETGGAFNG